MPSEQFFSYIYHGENKLHLDEIVSALQVLDQHAELDFYSVSSLKQQSAGRHVTPLRHIFLIPRQPVFVLTPYCSMLRREAANTNFTAFSLTRLELKPTIYCT